MNYLKTSSKQYPELNAEEERKMIKKHKRDRETLNKLLQLHNIKLVFNMAKKYMSRCLASLISREMQIKVARYYLTPVRMAIFKRRTSNKYRGGCIQKLYNSFRNMHTSDMSHFAAFVYVKLNKTF